MRQFFEDVKVAIKVLNGKGMLDLDGIPMFFYNNFQGLVRKEVMTSFNEFQRGNHGMDWIYKSHTSLLPKHQVVIRAGYF